MFIVSSVKLLCLVSQLLPEGLPATGDSCCTPRQTLCPLVPFLYAGYNRLVPSVSQSVRVKVLFFGRLKEIAGRTQDSIDLSVDADIESLFAHYSSRYPELRQYRSSLVASCNQEFAPWNTVLHAGDEVAFLPPVSGG